MRIVLQALLFLGMCAGIVAAMTAPAAANFPDHELAKIIFWHLPSAITCSFFMLAAPYFAFRFLRSGERHWEMRCAASVEITFLTGLVTLTTGIIFSKVQWGEPWTWDPRQTSFLLAILILAAYFALRVALPDREQRAKFSSTYVLASVLPILFLIFAYPRLMESLHPSTTLIDSKGLDPTYKSIFYSLFFLTLGLCIWIYKLRVRAALLEEAVENLHAEYMVSDPSAPTGVVRPISLPADGG